MYVPKRFSEDDRDTLYDVIRRYDFGILMCDTDEGLVATHLPVILEGDTLFAHMARANSHWKSFEKGKEVLVVFQGPHCYISPRWYQEPVNLPSWNYVAVHVYGEPAIPESADEIRAGQVKLCDHYEQGAWQLASQPEDYIEGKLHGLVSFRIPITRIEGKFKLNQNKSLADRRGVITALKDSDDQLAREVGEFMAMREA